LFRYSVKRKKKNVKNVYNQTSKNGKRKAKKGGELGEELTDSITIGKNLIDLNDLKFEFLNTNYKLKIICII